MHPIADDDRPRHDGHRSRSKLTVATRRFAVAFNNLSFRIGQGVIERAKQGLDCSRKKKKKKKGLMLTTRWRQGTTTETSG